MNCTQRGKGEIVKKGLIAALSSMALALPVSVLAQVAPTPETPAAAQTLETPPAAQPQTPLPQVAPRPAAPTPESRRHSIKLVEAVLSSAVRGGAEHLAEQLGSGSPNMSFFTGQARAWGFSLAGYGVFFHVEIPEMQLSLITSIATLERDDAISETIDSLRRAVSGVPESASRLQAEQALRRLDVLVGPVQPVADPLAAARPNMIRAANDSPPTDLPPRDPNAAYREAIKSALIDAMLEHSRGLNIQPDEWLTVAAQRGDSPLGPNEIVTTPMLELRIKGSDLALYDADRTRKDEIRKRVEAREF